MGLRASNANPGLEEWQLLCGRTHTAYASPGPGSENGKTVVPYSHTPMLMLECSLHIRSHSKVLPALGSIPDLYLLVLMRIWKGSIVQ